MSVADDMSQALDAYLQARHNQRTPTADREFPVTATDKTYNNTPEPPEPPAPRYLYNNDTGLWYDTMTGEYSVYDYTSQMYIPVKIIHQDDDDEDSKEPKSDAVLRLVVISSGLLTPGHVILVDANGLTIGRDRAAWDTCLRLAEMAVSKVHCQLYCETDKNKKDFFQIIDVGSRHGTFINGERLSNAKMSSLPRRLQHQDTLSIGSTVLKVHWHDPTEWPCPQCQAAGTQIIATVVEENNKQQQQQHHHQQQQQQHHHHHQPKEDLELSRRKELLRLKNSLAPKKEKTVYVDRAETRRRHEAKLSFTYMQTQRLKRKARDESEEGINTSHGREQEQVFIKVDAVTTETPVQGVGDRMLRKMGWREGQSLGKTGTGGILEPICPVGMTAKTGLGSQSKQTVYESPKTKAWRTTKERYERML
ncbi:hypothetical protein BDF14DRAFT_1881747 [Spinellus fusiger]|nr:hypothetical protein BDF14DRAFT_1881747 [Spinellus fusiger]